MQKFRIRPVTILLFILAGLVFVPLGTSFAQDSAVVNYGTSTVGNIPADGASTAFSFTGNAGDLVTARVVGLTPGMDPNLMLSGPSQEMLASNDNTLLLPSASDSEIVSRLMTSGSHTLTISGTAGDFLLWLQVRPPVQTMPLSLDVPTVVALPAQTANQVFVFNTDPSRATTLLIDAEPFNLNAFVEVRDSAGQLISLLGKVDNACLSFGPGDAVNEVMIHGSAEAVGQVTVTVSDTPCAFAPEPIVYDVQTIAFQPIPIANVCAASSYLNVNIRSGPGLNYPIISTLIAYSPIQVIGISQDGNWYAVQWGSFQGWLAASVTFVVGPCDALPVVQPPSPPALTPTPGVIIVTATPTSTDESDATEEPTSEVTAEPEETETVMPTETPAGEVTPEVTAEGTVEPAP